MNFLDFIEEAVRAYFYGVITMLLLSLITLVFFIVISKTFKKPLNTILDMYKISPQINIISVLLTAFTSWGGVITIFLAVFSVSATVSVNWLISQIVNIFTSSKSKIVIMLKQNGIISDFGIRGLFYKLFVPLEASYQQQIQIKQFNLFKSEWLEQHPNIKYLTYVPYKSDDLILLLNGKPWMEFYTSNIAQYSYGGNPKNILNKLESDILLQKLNKL